MKSSEKISRLPDIMKLIESLEEKLFSFYKSRDITSGMVKDRIDEYNRIETPLPEAYCSAMNHFIESCLSDYQELERRYFLKYRSFEKYEKTIIPVLNLDTLNVYQKVEVFNILESYLVYLTKELDLVSVYLALPQRTQEEIDRRSERIERQFQEWEERYLVRK